MGGHGGLNILPQKKWNVYNQDNKVKVKKDEAQAAAEEAERRQKQASAEAEHRLRRLRQNASSSSTSSTAMSFADRDDAGGDDVLLDPSARAALASRSGSSATFAPDGDELSHVQLFAPQSKHQRAAPNAEYENEKREAEARLESAFSMQLGGGSFELAKSKPFWMLPDTDRHFVGQPLSVPRVEAQSQRKHAMDPLALEAQLRQKRFSHPPLQTAPALPTAAPASSLRTVPMAPPLPATSSFSSFRGEAALPRPSAQRRSRWDAPVEPDVVTESVNLPELLSAAPTLNSSGTPLRQSIDAKLDSDKDIPSDSSDSSCDDDDHSGSHKKSRSSSCVDRKKEKKETKEARHQRKEQRRAEKRARREERAESRRRRYSKHGHDSSTSSTASELAVITTPALDAAALHAMRAARIQREAIEKAKAEALVRDPNADQNALLASGRYSEGYRAFAMRQ